MAKPKPVPPPEPTLEPVTAAASDLDPLAYTGTVSLAGDGLFALTRGAQNLNIPTADLLDALVRFTEAACAVNPRFSTVVCKTASSTGKPFPIHRETWSKLVALSVALETTPHQLASLVAAWHASWLLLSRRGFLTDNASWFRRKTPASAPHSPAPSASR